MKGNKLIRKLNKAALKVKRASPTILSCISIVGVLGTVAVTAKATTVATARIEHDREEHEKNDLNYDALDILQSSWTYYVPVIAVAGTTISCILIANKLSRKHQAALLSSYMMIQKSYSDYKVKVKELFGTDGANWVSEEIAKDNFVAEENVLEPEKELFYFEYAPGDGYFQSTREDVISALYHSNRNYQLRGYLPLNELLEFLQLKPVDGGNDIGWDSELLCWNGCNWVDFFLDKVQLEDGLECTRIDPDLIPQILWDEDYKE